MKKLGFYKQVYGFDEPDQVFRKLLSTLQPTNITWEYFVNWVKVFDKVYEIEYQLNLLNALIGKEDFEGEFKRLCSGYPDVVGVLPFLAVRLSKNLRSFKVLVNYKDGHLKFVDYDFTEYSPERVPDYLDFINKTGVKKLFQDGCIKNLVDYMTGLEAGLDSNARKNRSGGVMEEICRVFVEDLSQKKNYKYCEQLKDPEIKQRLKSTLTNVRLQDLRPDFVVETPDRLLIFEVNFYNTTGSKLKATAGEYQKLTDDLADKNVTLVWVTDGYGWHKSEEPLRQAFNYMDYIFNLDMLEKGILLREF